MSLVSEAYNSLQGFLYIWLTFYKSYCDELKRTKLTNLKNQYESLKYVLLYSGTSYDQRLVTS